MALRAVIRLLLLLASLAQAPVEFSCPMDKEVRAKGPGKCPKCGMSLVAAIQELEEYPVALKARTAGRKTNLEFRVTDPKTGRVVRDFEIVHERLFHLFVVSEDLSHFEHVHPRIAPDGAFRLSTELPVPGIYRLLCDFFPKGGTPQLIPKTVTTPGYAAALRKPVLKRDLDPKQGENLRVELRTEPEQPIAGKKTLLFFKVDPAAGFEPLLGAWGHLLVASDDRIDMIHEHPAIADGGPQVQFNVFFPREAMYRVWVQFQRAGKINTVAFTIPVTQLR